MARSFEEATQKMEQINNPGQAGKRGYRTIKEGYTTQISATMRQSYKDALDMAAKDRGKTRNKLINEIIESWIDKNYPDKERK